MNNIIYIGIDVANMCGIAYYNPDTHKAVVYEKKGTPVAQLGAINQVIKRHKGDSVNIYFVLEKQFSFQNAVTTRSILERYGFLKWSLLACDFDVWEISPSSARNFLGVKYNPYTAKETKRKTHELLRSYVIDFPDAFSNNHSDALAVAMKQANANGHLNTLVFPQIEVGSLLKDEVNDNEDVGPA